jgi:methionyl-tRNA formyltransferase
LTRAVVFGYHDVGCRCLEVLLRRRVEVPLVVTHEDAPGELIWFASLAALAARHGLPAVAPDDPNTPELIARVRALAPDLLFSFYYRRMLSSELLGIPRLGAYNIHGSLLPKYRGRVPVNWAVIRGETETGATLHEMVEKPDAGRIVDQEAVPIRPDETALEVFRKVTGAAERVLERSLPRLIDGSAGLRAQDLASGNYCRARRPEDGRIDWNDTAEGVHNLVRGVAPPYPGAFSAVRGKTFRVLRTAREPGRTGPFKAPVLFIEDNRCFAQCANGSILRILDFELDGQALKPGEIARLLGPLPIPLTEQLPANT